MVVNPRSPRPGSSSGSTVQAATISIQAAQRLTRLKEGRRLRVKLGVDPTAPQVHIGWAVVLRKLRQFQELGHTAVLIVGDFTALVGDPSGQSATRPALTKSEADANAATYFEQAQHILLPDRLEIRHNAEWLGEMGIDDVLRLAARSTV